MLYKHKDQGSNSHHVHEKPSMFFIILLLFQVYKEQRQERPWGLLVTTLVQAETLSHIHTNRKVDDGYKSK